MAPRWPPHFESNGGQYVYQATSGYFFNAATDFYYDPKSHLYLSARDGVYLQFDAAVQPPFRVFNPPAPTEPIALAHAHTVALTTEPPSHAGSGCVAPNNSTYQAPKPKVRLGLPAAAPTRSGAVGFGFGLSAAKKVKLDLAKWGSLQHEEEEEEEAGGKERGKQAVKSVKKTDCAAVATSDSPGSCLAILEKRTTAGEDVVAGECSRDRSGSMLVALAPTPATPLVTPSAQVSTVPVVAPAAPAAVHTPNLAPICLLCQRQFASFEMLQRHEKESKLHAENLKKLEKG